MIGSAQPLQVPRDVLTELLQCNEQFLPPEVRAGPLVDALERARVISLLERVSASKPAASLATGRACGLPPFDPPALTAAMHRLLLGGSGDEGATVGSFAFAAAKVLGREVAEVGAEQQPAVLPDDDDGVEEPVVLPGAPPSLVVIK